MDALLVTSVLLNQLELYSIFACDQITGGL